MGDGFFILEDRFLQGDPSALKRMHVTGQTETGEQFMLTAIEDDDRQMDVFLVLR